MIKICEVCQNDFSTKNKKKRSCSKECSKIIIKKTMIEKYGVEHPYQSEEIKNKMKQSMIEKHGGYTLQSKELKEKVKQTNLDKYGVENVFQSKEFKDQIKKTNLDKYGVENMFQSEEFKDQIKKTMIEKYGVEHALQSDVLMEKSKQTCLEKFGVENGMMSEEVQNKVKQTNLERYGVEHPLKNQEVRRNLSFQRSHLSLEEHNILFNQMNSQDWWDNQPSFIEVKDQLKGILSSSSICLYTHKFRPDWKLQSSISYPHQKIINLLDQHQISYEINNRQIIKPLELDIWIPSHSLAIEVNGLYWHSELNGKDRTYHVSKTDACEQQNILLLQFWDIEIENQWDIIQSMILSRLGIYQTRTGARECQVIQVKSNQEKEFLNENHLQGYRPSSICLGLEYQNELVSLMSFSKPRFSSKSDWELLRFCNRLNTQVIGGASKLFSQRPEGSIISYSDRRYSQGNLYFQLEMNRQNDSAPSYYYTKDYQILENRMKYQKHKLSEKLKIFNPELTEWNNMVANGFDRVWDCGNSKWILYE